MNHPPTALPSRPPTPRHSIYSQGSTTTTSPSHLGHTPLRHHHHHHHSSHSHTPAAAAHTPLKAPLTTTTAAPDSTVWIILTTSTIITPATSSSSFLPPSSPSIHAALPFPSHPPPLPSIDQSHTTKLNQTTHPHNNNNNNNNKQHLHTLYTSLVRKHN